MVYDVIVVGAGPAGSVITYYLANQGINVLLLDKAAFPRDKTCGDALSPRALAILNEIGVLDNILQHAFRTSKVDFYSPSGKEVSFDLPGKKQLADICVVERLTLDDLLYERAVSAGAETLNNASVQHIVNNDDVVDVDVLVNGKREKYYSRLVVLATGANVALLRRLDLIAANVNFTLASRIYFEGPIDFASLKFIYADVPLPGYAWLFPVGEDKINVGAGFSKATRQYKYKTSKQLLEHFLSTRLAQKYLGNTIAVGKIKSFPIFMDFPNTKVFADRLLIVGEAAGLVNPLTGEGVDYAMQSGKIAADVILGAFEAGDFSAQALKQYKVLLDKEYYNQFMASRYFQKILFSNKYLLNTFFSALQGNESLRNIFLKVALGFSPFLDKK